jgi:hypothetical protein
VTQQWAHDMTTFPNYIASGDHLDDVNYYNWNRFFFIYCDGTGHQGYIEEPQIIKNKPIYFRGYNIT